MHHAAGEHMVHTSKAVCTPTELDGSQLTTEIFDGKTVVKPRTLQDDAGRMP